MVATKQFGEPNETIFNLIPRARPIVPKPPRHVCGYKWNAPPTSSTFGPSSTTQLLVTNLSGSPEQPPMAHNYWKKAALFGPKHSQRPDPKNFVHKKNRSVVLDVNPKPEGVRQAHGCIGKVPVPAASDRPIMGLVTSKNFIKTNAIGAILSEPLPREKKLRSDMDGHHVNYGKVPEYLEGVKQEIKIEYEYINKLQSRDEALQAKEVAITPLDEADRIALLNALKSKWGEIQRQYQTVTHHVILDTIGEVRRKEGFERDLLKLESDIEKISKPNVLVRSD